MPTAAQPACRFVLGFATLRDLVGATKVGACLEDEHFNQANGNAEIRATVLESSGTPVQNGTTVTFSTTRLAYAMRTMASTSVMAFA